jgi:Ca-activated chloride channel family protein
MKALRWLLGLGLCLGLSSLPTTAGLIVVPEPPSLEQPIYPPRPPRPIPLPHSLQPPARPYYFAPLETTLHQVHVRIEEQIASTKVDQEFYNPNAQQMEGTFLFPVPKGAQLNKFTMEIDGKQVEAELLAADKARGIYEDIVRRTKDPALLEYAGQDLFKVRIFPMEAHGKKRVSLSYSQVLRSEDGVIQYVYPLKTEKFSAKPVKNLSVKIEIESKRALKSIYSPSHNVEVRHHGEHKATLGYEATEVRPDSDFQLFFTRENGDVGASLMTYRRSGEDGYFLLLAAPSVEVKKDEIVLKDIVFVLDTSGSMAGKKLAQAKKALQFCVENLSEGDRFEIMRFATETEPLFNKLVEASKENRSKAESFIQDLKPIGGTAIDDALRKALSLKTEKSDRPFVIIFLTDGLPTVGVTSEEQIMANVRKGTSGNTRIFCFGIGTDVNTHLLDKITEETKAVSQYVLPEEDLEIKVSSFFTKIKQPVLANLKITFPEGVRATKFYPAPLPDLFKGEQLLLAGRYSGTEVGKLFIEGTANDASKKFGYDVKFADEATEHDFIPRLWATRRIGYLLDEIRLHGENKELKDEATDLARKFGIVTPYTAYLIVEDEAKRNIPEMTQSLPQLHRNREARREAGEAWQMFHTQTTGDAAVAGARYGLALKSANQSAGGIASGNQEGLRALSAVSSSPALAPAMPNNTKRRGASAQGPDSSDAQLDRYNEQARFVGGRSFYQNGNQWIDTNVQSAADAQRRRIQFNSQDYFDLVAKQPQIRAWLALGRNVQFVWDKMVYEIYE